VVAALTYAITVSPFALVALVLAAASVVAAVVVARRRAASRAVEPARPVETAER
jgi:hypothetical protein